MERIEGDTRGREHKEKEREKEHKEEKRLFPKYIDGTRQN